MIAAIVPTAEQGHGQGAEKQKQKGDQSGISGLGCYERIDVVDVSAFAPLGRDDARSVIIAAYIRGDDIMVSALPQRIVG